MSISIVIPTYNRSDLLRRCLQSATSQSEPALEILVVDDCSPQNFAEAICREFAGVQYLQQDRNRGPGPARNLGLLQAVGEWVIPLDDDDELLPGAIATIREHASQLAEMNPTTEWSVMQFAVYGKQLIDDLRIATIDDYLFQRLPGECKPVLHRESFLRAGFKYPELRIGGESLLWWEVARRTGIPTWRTSIMRYHDDAGDSRLTSFDNQVTRAAEYADLQERLLAKFGDLLADRAPEMLSKKQMGAAVYWLLAGEPARAACHLQVLRHRHPSWQTMAYQLLPYVPAALMRRAFLTYRDFTAGQARRIAKRAA